MAQTGDDPSMAVPSNPRYEKGEHYTFVYGMDEEMKATGSPMGDWEMKNKIEQTWEFEVKKVAKDGSSRHVGVLKRVVVVADMGPQGTMKYDTDEPTGGQMGKHFQGMLGTEITLEMEPSGDIESAKDAEVLQGHMFKKEADYDGNDHLKESWNVLNAFPEGAVSDGKSWVRKRDGTSFYPFVAELQFVLEDADTDGQWINCKGKVQPNPNSIPTTEMGMKIDYQFTGSVSGKFQYDAVRERMSSGELAWDLEGDCNMILPDGKTTTFPVTLQKVNSFISTPITD